MVVEQPLKQRAVVVQRGVVQCGAASEVTTVD